jgi:L-amino acid N-acyltransferase YncA
MAAGEGTVMQDADALLQARGGAPVVTRPAIDADAPAMSTLLNEIIRVGGTTAITNELSEEEMRDWFISGPEVVSCFVAVADDGGILGFQGLSTHGDLPAGWVDIATFASRARQQSGVGSALFARTRELARERGFVAINASIRVVNTGGLAYYSRMGFVDYLVEDGDPAAQGRRFNRVHKRFDLGQPA